jgi:DNA-binding NarL/FixJ family response regulator
MSEKINILCVDDHRLVREGIAQIIGLQSDMAVVASCDNGLDAVRLFAQVKPDVTLMDLQLPEMNGLDAIRAIRARHADARIIVLTMYHGDEEVYSALRAGAAAYVPKDVLSSELIRVIREVWQGATPLPDEIAARGERRAFRRALLSDREEQVLKLIAQGMRNKEMATALGIAEETVQVYVKKIFAKLDVHDRVSAVAAAVKRGILRSP